MPNRITAASVGLNRIHSGAVCNGIGERLRDALGRESSELPSHLRQLIERLPELDENSSPSIVPDMDH